MTVTFPIYEGNKASLRLEHNNDENKDLASGADNVGSNDRGTNSGTDGYGEGIDAKVSAARDGESDGEDPNIGAKQGDGEGIDAKVGDASEIKIEMAQQSYNKSLQMSKWSSTIMMLTMIMSAFPNL